MQTIHGLDIPQSLSEFLDPSRVALIIYDMQIGIARQVKERESVIDRLASFLSLRARRMSGLSSPVTCRCRAS